MMTMNEKDLEKLMKEDPAAEEASAEEKETAAEEASAEKSEADELREALEAEKDQHLRLMAEYQNYRNRTTEEKKKIYGDVAERVVEILDAVPALGSVYDPANFLQDGELPEKTLPLLHARSTYFHIKDVIVETGELVPAGYGDGAIDRLVEMIDRDAVLTVEPHLKVFAGYAEIDGEEMKNKFHFASNGEAFDAAISAIKTVLTSVGYVEENGAFIKH